MIAINSIMHQYDDGTKLIFKDWQINNGDQWLLLGESGSGKTTLLHVITGILKPLQGNVLIAGTNIYQLSSKNLDLFRGKNIGIVFQRPHLIKSLTITENLLLAQNFAKLPSNKKRIEEVLNSLEIGQKKNTYPSALSQGQLQRVSIARAIINKPTLLIADEPTSSLDDKNAATVLNLLKEIAQLHQTTLVVATHDQRVKDAFTHTYNLT